MHVGQPYANLWYCTYFKVQISQGVYARFRRNRFTRKTEVFQFNCEAPCRWNEEGYGWGKWTKV